ncbi:MAG: NACHT domain-containing protein [Leptolyngbyaceae bacterium]|nr:NACHT domain-containing protein [Leptolyngbyaceae bacterium]
MLDILLSATAGQVGKLGLEQVLELGQGALEDYAQDFFKDSLGGGVAKLKASVLKGPMGEAVGEFIKVFVQELKDNDVPDSSIKHHYTGAIKQLVKDRAVKPILGQAFETSCEVIDYGQLAEIWTQQYRQPGWGFPDEEFRWKRVAKKYVTAVKGIVKGNEELRSLLTTDLLEQIAQNTTLFSPGFDTQTYRESLQASYGYLKLYTLDSTDRVDAIKLWRMFIEQTVREALPPTRYDLPLDIKRRLQAEGQLEDALTPEELEYYQQPAWKALDAVMDAPRSVILGDPGAGKSTLLQYLALEWVEGKTDVLPLLIELREYVLDQSPSFLDFLHSGSGADWQFDQKHLHQYLAEQPTLVMFDGLDEVFDRPTQSAIIDDIIRFAQQYPQSRVVVTSRIIGYNPERFRHADFHQFTIQPLDETEIHEFIDRWYDLAMGADPDKVRLKERLKEAISQSKAIQNLADNPLLLTMMAILNRRQELPRDRADLYDQASRVLLYHWDVDHKRLQLPLDAIGRREKQEILRLIAYEMQAGEDGLKGNLISADRLTRILTDYLINQGFSEPREKASQLIQQLRERNFILCYRGADTYGFMHRTFLEYFCAIEIVHRFEKQRTLTFEQLRDEVFGQHWQDETWHEVLRLICGSIDPKFSGELIRLVVNKGIDKSKHIEFSKGSHPKSYLKPSGLINLILAADCLSEVKNIKEVDLVREDLLKKMKREIQQPAIALTYKLTEAILNRIAQNYPETLEWLQAWVESPEGYPYHYYPCYDYDDSGCHSFDVTFIPSAALSAIARNYHSVPGILSWLKSQIGNDCLFVPQAAISEIAHYYHNNPDILTWLKDHAQDSEEVIEVVYRMIAKYYRDDPNTILWLKTQLQEDYSEIKVSVLEAIATYYKDDSQTFQLLQNFARQDRDEFVRYSAVEMISENFKQETKVFALFCDVTRNDPLEPEDEDYGQLNPRQAALEALLIHYPTHPQTLELLRDRAENDPDEQLREWAQEQLQQMENQGGSS